MHTLLIVDDDPDVLAALRRAFRKGYNVVTADNGSAAISILNEQTVHLIICDQRMPGVTGEQVLEHALFKQPDAVRILLTGYSDMESLVACVNEAHIYKYVAKPWDPQELSFTVARALDAYDLKRRLDEAQGLLESAYEDAVLMLCIAAEGKDEDTSSHLYRVRHYTETLAIAMGVPAEQAEHMGLMSMLHDIGKLSVPDEILKKPGKLSDDEWVVMKTHSMAGVRILGGNMFYGTAREICAGHHENYDGSGYPYGIKGSDIPLSARIVKVADVFDALTTKRPYKDAWPVERAMAEINDKKSIMFDPDIVVQMQKLFETGELRAILDMGEEAAVARFHPKKAV
ncbi:response regulator [Candidatus Methylospira mobilis]|uniref:HD domain-containing phosphohydrolase n=1 Tax=Candidatus Methylospira mobilis TaxID=1808979 RepID=UPI0028F042B8|nr:HD domain-containing phosphohydrolase [Candidatus Methylospira mobilis]WNV04822.1 response regulator [Candidatus Methylospira mobilis]